MEIKIKETGEIKELNYIGIDGIDCVLDITGDDDNITYNSELDVYEASAEVYDFWTEYFDHMSADDIEVKALKDEIFKKYEYIEAAKIEQKFYDKLAHEFDYGLHHTRTQEAIVYIKERYL